MDNRSEPCPLNFEYYPVGYSITGNLEYAFAKYSM